MEYNFIYVKVRNFERTKAYSLPVTLFWVLVFYQISSEELHHSCVKPRWTGFETATAVNSTSLNKHEIMNERWRLSLCGRSQCGLYSTGGFITCVIGRGIEDKRVPRWIKTFACIFTTEQTVTTVKAAKWYGCVCVCVFFFFPLGNSATRRRVLSCPLVRAFGRAGGDPAVRLYFLGASAQLWQFC